MYKNIEKQEIFEMKNKINYQDCQVVSKTLVQNEFMSMTIFAFEKEEEISTHASKGDAMVTVLEGVGEFIVDGEKYLLKTGESLIMPKNLPHSVFAIERFKMLLVVSF